MLGILDEMTVAAAGLDWTRPAGLEDARARKFARDACPAEENDESPNECMLTDGERAQKRGKVIDDLTKLARGFFDACRQKAAELQKDLDADQRLAELVAGFAADLIIGVITGGAGGVAAAVVTKSALPASVTAFGRELGKSALKAAITKAPRSLGAGDSPRDERRDTIGALDALAAEFQAAIDASVAHLEALDDGALMLLEATLEQYDRSQLEAHVRAFAKAYREQVAPIGMERPDSPHLDEHPDLLRAGRKATVRAARIALPGGRTRLALVEHITDGATAGALRQAGRTALVGLDRAVGDHDDAMFSGPAYRDRQDAWVAARSAEVHFVRWIDDPRMQMLAATAAIDVAADDVADLPLDALVPQPAAAR